MHSQTRIRTCMHMCIVFPVFVSVFPLYSHYRIDEILVSLYDADIPIPIYPLLRIFQFSLVYLSLSLPISRVVPTMTSVVYTSTSTIYLCAYIFRKSFSFFHVQLSSVFFLFLSICSWICAVAYLTFYLPISTFLSLHSLLSIQTSLKTHKNIHSFWLFQ